MATKDQLKKKALYCILYTFILLASGGYAEETRQIHLIQDDAQRKMVTKIYKLKYVQATDIRPWVDAAAKRYTDQSTLCRISIPTLSECWVGVTTATEMMPYIDDLVAKLDRPGKMGPDGSLIEGTGVTKGIYYPKYTSTAMLQKLCHILTSPLGAVYDTNSTLYWKDDKTYSDGILEWAKYFDQPAAQTNLTLKYYLVRESKLRDLGIDYLAWKNGPGLNMLDFAYDAGRATFSRATSLATHAATWGYGSFLVAPAFDMSFVRMLQQSGSAEVMATANATFISGAESNLTLDPVLQMIQKDENDTTSVMGYISPLLLPSFNVRVGGVIGLEPETSKLRDSGQFDMNGSFFAKNKGNLLLNYALTSNDVTEVDNNGAPVETVCTLASDTTLAFGDEVILQRLTRNSKTEETIGVPFLCEVPVLKYLFGTTTTINEKIYIFVTVKASLVNPDAPVPAK